MDIVFNISGASIIGSRAQDDFSYSVSETPIITGGTVGTQSFYDTTSTITVGAGVTNNCNLNVSDSLLIPGHSFVNNTPAIVSVSGGGAVAMLAVGTASVDVVTPIGTRNFTRAMTNSGAQAQAFASYKAGSLGAHVTAQIAAMIAGKAAAQATQKLTSSNNYNATSLAAARNSNLFTGAIDLSAISLARSSQPDEVFPYMLISPRHVIAANHITSLDRVAWMSNAGVAQSANIVSWAGDVNTDIAVGYLGNAIAGITPFTFLPTTWQNYMASVLNGSTVAQRMPCMAKLYKTDDANSYLSAMMVYELREFDLTNCLVNSGKYVNAAYLSWTDGTRGVAGGDSGSPIMLPINGQLVLLSAHWGVSGGTNYAAKSTWIETQMNTLAAAQGDNTAYSLSRSDLSSFTQYPTL